MIIALDVDGVLADCASVVHAAAERILKTQLNPVRGWHSFDFSESMLLSDEQSDKLFSTLIAEDRIGWQIKLYPGADRFVKQLQAAGHDVFFLTAQWEGMDCWVPARTELLKQHFKGTDIVFTHSKHRAVFDVLVEDRASTVQRVGAERCILFEQPWNATARQPGIVTASTYEEILELVELICQSRGR